jgi:hypothetical protein
MGVLQRKEFVFPILLSIAFIVLGSFPYWYGYATAAEDEVFMGFVGRGTPGAQGYLMLARQVMDDGHLMENKMTPEPLPDTYFNLEYWLFGKFAKHTGLGLLGTFHAWRAMTVIGYLCAVYFLAALCLPSLFQRRIALLLIACGSGLGWMIWTVNTFTPLQLDPSLDLKGVAIPGYLVNKPHFIRGGLFAVLQYACLILGERSGKRRYFVYCGLAALAHSIIRPYHLPETYLILALFPILLCAREGRIDYRRLGNYFTAGLVLFPVVLYYGWMAYENTLGMAGWKRQSLFLLQDFFWMGIPFVVVSAHFACLGFSRWRSAPVEYVLIALWLFTAWCLNQTFPYFTAGHELAFYAYTTVPPLLLFGVTIPTLGRLLPASLTEAVATRRRLAAAALLLATLPTSVYVYANFFTDLHQDTPWTHYLKKDVHASLSWLEENTSPDSVILASHDTSQFVPVLADRKVVSGHDMLTAWYEQKNGEVQRFFATPDDLDFKREMITRYRITHIIEGPDERALGQANLSALPFLNPIHHQGNTTIYETR